MKKIIGAFALLCLLVACGGGGGGSESVTVSDDNNSSSGSSSNNTNTGGSSSTGSGSGFSKKVDVFGISILATSGVSDDKVLHAAKVMAEYLDNNNDGTVDNSTVHDTLKSKNAYLFIVASESEEQSVTVPSGSGQILYANEIHPEGSSSSSGFDATLEEVLHLLSHAGWSIAYPNAFGETSSLLTDAMDVARGGKFTTIPNPYPDGAWYTYNDSTCDYQCMATEYFYWGLTSILGAQEYSGRLEDIQNEWTLNTEAKVKTSDTLLYALLTDSQYQLPTQIPDGVYTAATLSITTP